MLQHCVYVVGMSDQSIFVLSGSYRKETLFPGFYLKETYFLHIIKNSTENSYFL